MVLVSRMLRGCCWELARCWRCRCFEVRKAFQLAASRVKLIARALDCTNQRQICSSSNDSNGIVHSPALRASRSDLPFSISSSSRRYLSLSSRSLFSESSRTDFKNAAGSRSSGAAASVVLLSSSCGASSSECWEVDGPVGLGRGGAECTVLLVAITNNNNTAAAAEATGIRPREIEQPAARCYGASGMWDCRREVYVQARERTRQAGWGIEL
jgi:hypothetical protein